MYRSSAQIDVLYKDCDRKFVEAASKVFGGLASDKKHLYTEIATIEEEAGEFCTTFIIRWLTPSKELLTTALSVLTSLSSIGNIRIFLNGEKLVDLFSDPA